MIEKPQKPYKNFEECRRLHSGRYHRDDPEFIPCLACSGRGHVRDPKDRDLIEGYKLAPWYDCKSCNGTGRGTKKELMDYYRERLADWKERMKRYKYKVARLHELQQMIDEDDFKIIFEHMRTGYV